ncbi:hypothetical protein RhiJN_15786 [Ceratobasidium sp. AG-Ba]|nr:hypothetical protein RhiJN_15786 [Ceratobasidium sp. AG-Ba]
MPLSRDHGGNVLNTTDANYQAGTTNDPSAYGGAGSVGGSTQQGAYTGQPQGTTHHGGHSAAATAEGAMTGAMTGHKLGGHAGPGAAIGGMAGNHASHEHNQPPTTYNDKYNYNGTESNIDTGIGPKHPGMTEAEGKAQQVAGMVLSSETMKSKGFAKEQEAAAARHQRGDPR